MRISTYFTLSIFLFGIGTVSAQAPSNDNCTGAISLISNAGCTTGTVYQATTQSGEDLNLPCTNGNSAHTVWYSFVATSSKMYVQMYKTALMGSGSGYTDDRWAMEVYNSSSCLPSVSTQIACANTNSQGNHDEILELNLTTLTIGSTYLIQVAYKPGNGAQTPQFCISVGDNYSASCNSCSSACGAACIFNSVPSNAAVTTNCIPHNMIPYLEGDQTTSQCYTFTATSSIMNFGVGVNSNCSGTNTASFSWTLYNSACGSLQTGTGSSKAFSGLTVGQSYTFCYTITSWPSCYHTAYYPYVYPNQTLPIELSEFAAAQNGDGVMLNWTTQSELNNRSFTIQRSEDGKNFKDVAVVEGNGTTSVQHLYTFTDTLPIRGTGYYRLKQTDYLAQESGAVQESNGTFDSKMMTASGDDDDVTSVNFSPVVAAAFQPQQTFEFKLIGDKAQIDLFQPGQSMVMICDEQGIVIYRSVVSAPAQLQIPVQNKRGIWYACLIDGNHKQLMKAF